MPDRDEVIRALTICIKTDCANCEYRPDVCCINTLLSDTLSLLKEQEAREPHYTTLKYLVDGTEVSVHHPECPRCIENGLMLWDAEIEKGQAFCKRCGQAVKWE